MPISVRDLPVLPGALEIAPSEYGEVPLPDLDREDAGFVLSVAATFTEMIGDSPLWGIARFMVYTSLSLGLLGILIYR
jgi:hypothetical protein